MRIRRRPRSPLPRIGVPLLVAGVLVVAGCSGSESSSPSTTAPVTTTAARATPPTTAPPTTAPPTIAPPTTATATTSPPTTSAPPTSPPTTAPLPDVDLTQFCFDSEQVYVAAGAIDRITEPTATQAEAALRFLVATAESAVASAPEGFGDEPARLLEIVNELDALFARYAYDVEDLAANEDPADFDQLFDDYDVILIDQLTPFLDEVCGSPVDLLDVQAAKLAPAIEAFSANDLVAITNQVGDIRVLVPAAWSDLLGSTQADEVTLLQAAPDIESFDASWDAAGVLAVAYYIEAGVADPGLRIPGTGVANGCDPVDTEPYDDGFYTGVLALYRNCGDVGTDAAVVAVANVDGSVEATLEFQFPDGLDRDLLDQMLVGLAFGA